MARLSNGPRRQVATTSTPKRAVATRVLTSTPAMAKTPEPLRHATESEDSSESESSESSSDDSDEDEHPAGEPAFDGAHTDVETHDEETSDGPDPEAQLALQLQTDKESVGGDSTTVNGKPPRKPRAPRKTPVTRKKREPKKVAGLMLEELPSDVIEGEDVVLGRGDYVRFKQAIVSSLTEIQSATLNQIENLQAIHNATAHVLRGFLAHSSVHLGPDSKAATTSLGVGMFDLGGILNSTSTAKRVLLLDPVDLAHVATPGATVGMTDDETDKKSRKSDGKRKPKKERDPNMPVRPGTSYLLFCQSARSQVRNELTQRRAEVLDKGLVGEGDDGSSDVPTYEVQAELTRRWTEMSDPEKEVWRQRYQSLFADYSARMKVYKQSITDFTAPSTKATELQTPTTPMSLPARPVTPVESDVDGDVEDEVIGSVVKKTRTKAARTASDKQDNAGARAVPVPATPTATKQTPVAPTSSRKRKSREAPPPPPSTMSEAVASSYSHDADAEAETERVNDSDHTAAAPKRKRSRKSVSREEEKDEKKEKKEKKKEERRKRKSLA